MTGLGGGEGEKKEKTRKREGRRASLNRVKRGRVFEVVRGYRRMHFISVHFRYSGLGQNT